ncbi:MAG: 30S ribosomal protein S16 [Candidatus Levybacteria bacterium RIFCSPHIGHO2_02_FULL_37_10]|uniref:Small ribosomal subunit protein bS16 n=1 Tax=Candidatus Portnoybacteria bacterium RIFCSPHIGHO2_01_FULL_40_12b TaxID=1801994 RepID=A0A1G2FC89_9BACT|nr:MAG: 30S ribosomal protein S16 [Candidatus Levybacteria bacterium RIFCSPHIGHO2_02_FULL_37_10]OGZ35694.1 MAG: 30S ribosomal protein S16 [Candidatus Portnoybacteria bacterium RIFCSPHIGHO2_01_FULL_40_12b]
MSVVIRLSKIGKRGEGRYRVVVMEKRYRRDGKPIEILGWYEKKELEQNRKINKKRYDYWISKGAKPSATVMKIALN